MSEFDKLQRLIQLKRYETPGEDFVEDFLTRFHQRQRAELLRQSARSLLWERVATYWENLVSPRWTAAAVTACVAVVAAWGTIQLTGTGNLSDGSAVGLMAAAEPALPIQPAIAVESELIREVEQGRQLEIEGILLSRHFESEELQSFEDESIAGVSGAAMPISAELIPLSGFNR
jgi:hypothetical protein